MVKTLKKSIKIMIGLVFLTLILIIYYLYNNNAQKDDAYLINLDNRKDRLYNVTMHFINHFNIIKTSAVYITDNIRKEKYPNAKLRNGQIGCGLSHINIVKFALKNKLSTVLIIEDDCIPTKHFSNWIPIKQWLDSNLDKWDIFTGGNCAYNHKRKTKEETIKPICSLTNSIKLYYTEISCAHFIYVNSRAYTKIIEWENNINKDIGAFDTWFDTKQLACISCTPFIAIQEISLSDIGVGENGPNVFSFTETVISDIENNKKC
jgi:GR25 family glycosyltransferase involved in LPS biosynthesis